MLNPKSLIAASLRCWRTWSFFLVEFSGCCF